MSTEDLVEKCLKRYVDGGIVPGEWIVYVLKSNIKNATYVGATNNCNRRLRQHNGILKNGGAKATTRYRPWRPIFIIKGFQDNHQALSFEWSLKHQRRVGCKKGGVEWRRKCLETLLNRPRWTSKSPESKDIPLQVFHFLDNTAFEEIPKHITVTNLPLFV
jgi:predicted GIY-YIG superfamily endonuclease